ncbi:MAG TPA: TonB-dependent receptor [Bacteroidales bacterium]|nr:TonB-dependent receptor [Bacteroidales bacterium]
MMNLFKRMCLMLVFLAMNILVFGQGSTTSSMSGQILDGKGEPLPGATVMAIHVPSGSVYGAYANEKGQFSIQGMRPGGPYKVTVSFIGYSAVSYTDITLSLGENYILNADLKEGVAELGEVVVSATSMKNMKSDRAGAITSVNRELITATPTVSRSMNDVMRLSPQSSTTSNGYAVGGGNYRQSYVTVDGAAFNNAFGIGANLPASGSPISLDALEEVTVSLTPYDVRQSGFVGGAINAVTRSGDNEFKGSAYTFMNGSKFQGDKVGDYELTKQDTKYKTYGLSIGGPIIKNKLFFFFNGEYEDNVSPGPSFILSQDGTTFGTDNIVRPTQADVDAMKAFLATNYNYDPGRITNYPSETPSLRLMGRFDWNINENNKLNLRLSHTKSKYSSTPSSSVSPLTTNQIYPGNTTLAIAPGLGRTSNYAMYFESSRYFQNQNFSSIATELNSSLFDKKVNNMLRFTYSYQDEPRSYAGDAFPTVDILKDGATYMSFGPDPFTAGNTRVVSTYVVTDEATLSVGFNNFMAGLQYEYQNAINGFMQGGNGYYVFASMNDFYNNAKPSAFAITHSNSADLSQFKSELAFKQYSFYLQDQMNITNNFRVTAGLRFELPSYPSIEKTNFNQAFANLDFGGTSYSTAQLPEAKMNFSPRIGFNWDLTGERKYVVRGGTGVFTGRLPYVWLVSVVGNANVGQTQYFYNRASQATGVQPDFHNNLTDILSQLYGGNFTPATPTAPASPTILSKDLRMPSTWKTSLAFDAVLPGDVTFTLEGIYNKDINPVVVSNTGYYESGTRQLNANDTRKTYTRYINNQNVYLIENNKENDSYYYSVTAQLGKKFNFGLDMSFAYTHSNSKSYSDGIGDQVTSAFSTNTFSINGTNEHDLGYGTYVAPDRIIATIGYKKDYGKNFSSGLYFVYDGSQLGYAGGYSYTRFSYTMGNVVGDNGSNNLLYIPASRSELDSWTFADAAGYTGLQQKDDFWAYIEQDKYLNKHKGEYAERGGAIFPWHNQLDLKFVQDFYLNVSGKKNTLEFGLDIKNLPNLLNSDWGLYKTAYATNILNYNTTSRAYTFPKVNNEVLKSTFKDYQSFTSTYLIQLSLRYIFN